MSACIEGTPSSSGKRELIAECIGMPGSLAALASGRQRPFH
jgi:hypothetical protein